MENIIVKLLLFLHILGFIGLVGGPLYLIRVPNQRAKLGVGFTFWVDKFMENILRVQPSRCFWYMMLLIVTGVLLGAVEWGWDGLAELLVGPLGIKLVLVLAILFIILYGWTNVAPRIEAIVNTASPDQNPSKTDLELLARLRKRRKQLCTVAGILGAIVIFISVFYL
jgi:uncharacterized membrane protein